MDATGPGEVVTYGEVAAEAGHPGAARAVGRVLREHGGTVAWWRVVDAAGRLVPGLADQQAARLRSEGVICDDGHVRRPGPGHRTRSREERTHGATEEARRR